MEGREGSTDSPCALLSPRLGQSLIQFRVGLQIAPSPPSAALRPVVAGQCGFSYREVLRVGSWVARNIFPAPFRTFDPFLWSTSVSRTVFELGQICVHSVQVALFLSTLFLSPLRP